MSEPVCFRCKRPGHTRAQCKESRAPEGVTVPAGNAAAAAPKWRGNPVPPRRPDAEIARDPHGWANYARSLLGELPTCGQQADLYASEFRRSAGLAPVHQCVLRQLAAAQVNESRSAERAAIPERQAS